MGKSKYDEEEYYVSADGGVHSSRAYAIAASLSFEASSDTNAGCNQSADGAREQEDREEKGDDKENSK